MDNFTRLVEVIQTQPPIKWFVRDERLCDLLGIERAELGALLDRITRGGTGSKKNGTFESNPEPCNMRIDLKSSNENALNLHYTTVKGRGSRVEFTEPSPDVIEQTGKYFQFGRLIDKNRYFDVNLQKEAIHHITGTGKLIQLNPKLAERRNKLFLPWLRGEPEGEVYERFDLPHIAVNFAELWSDAKISKQVRESRDTRNVTHRQCELRWSRRTSACCL